MTPAAISPPGGAPLYERVLKAGAWTIGTHGIDFITRLLSTLIMTRLLFPEAFGLVSAASSILLSLSLVSDLGVHTVILQSPRGNDEAFLRTSWTLQACRGIGVWLLLTLACLVVSLPGVRSALPPSSAYADPQFPLVTAAMGSSIVISCLESTTVYLPMRALALKPIFFLDLVTRTIPLPVMAIWAWFVPSVWALVGGGLAAGIVRLVLTHIALPGPRMKVLWNKEHVREIVHFGKWINVSSAATFVGSQGDRFFLGLLLPSSMFGMYNIATTLVFVALGVFEKLNGTLAIPVLSEVIRRNPRDLKDRYYRFRWPFDIFAPLAAGFLMSAGDLIVSILYDGRYAATGQMVQILAFGLLIYPSTLIGTAFTANGEPRIGAIGSIAQAISIIVCASAGFLIAGEVGAIYGTAIHKLAPAAMLLIIARTRGWIELRKEIRILLFFAAGIGLGEAAQIVARTIGIA